jgi:glycosyltransferase involved in cell wall biosynthesis
MQDPKLLSIIIPCYNDAEYIEQSVKSALDQTYNNKEIIVVDDGSNQKTKEVLNKLETKIDLLITQKNQGVSAARNRGIAEAKGEYILVLDSDDFFDPSFSEKAVKILDNKNTTTLVTCFARWFWNAQDYRIYKPKGGKVKDFLLSNAAIGNSIFRKFEFKKIGGYDEEMLKGYEDWEFYLRLLQSGGNAEVIPEVLFNYRIKENSRNKKANLIKYDLLRYIYIKHEDLYKEYFSYFILEWLDSVRNSEAFKQQVMDSLDYKIGNKLLKPLRKLGFFKNHT